MMKRSFPWFALAVFLGFTCAAWSPGDAGIGLSDPEAVKHHGTVVRPVADEPLTDSRNVLWCATFQMAWDAAAASQGGKLDLRPASRAADSLNRGRFDLRWIDAESIHIAGGSVGDGVLDRIAGADRKRGGPSRLLGKLRKESAADDLVFYASLHKDIGFPTPFAKLGSWKAGERKVAWFGFRPDQEETGPLLAQVAVHHHAARTDFVVELKSQSGGDRLLLAKLPRKPATLEAAARAVIGKVRKDAPNAGAHDLLAVPQVVADEEVSFSEFEGRTLPGGRFVRSASQTINFRMDEKGAKLRSEAQVSLGCSAHPHIDPRLMILDPPFVIVMMAKDAPKPYFIGWMANADLLAD
jgi:hypothetical protein